MNNHALLDIIGEVNEDYVLAADSGPAQPRFRWQTLAACAACAVLIAAAYPAWQALSQKPTSDSVSGLEEGPEASEVLDETLIQRPGLHEYTLVEGGMTTMTTEGVAKAPAGGGVSVPAHEPAQSFRGDLPGGVYVGGEADGTTDAAGSDASVQEEASVQYERLLRGMGVYGQSDPVYPDWFGGAWLDGDQEELLTVAIVYGFRTLELEEQIRDWCGGTKEIRFTGAIYSQNHVDGLMKEIDRVFEELNCQVFLSYGVYVSDNCIHLDFFEVPSDEILAVLAELDPAGNAILIQVFAGVRCIPTDGPAKGPALAAPAAPVEPSVEAEPTPVPADGSAAVAEPSVPPAP